jgi:hypothetical protein
MNHHPYLRAYMAGISVPTPFLLVVVSLFTWARLLYNLPMPIERIVIFPMAIIPNLWGLWNMLYLAVRPRTGLSLGIHGALLPLIIAPAGFLLGRSLGVLRFTGHSVVYFGAFDIYLAHIAVFFFVAVIIYYLVWKYLIGSFNRVLGIGEY